MRFTLRRRALGRALGLGTAACCAVLAVGSTVSAQTRPASDRTEGRELPARFAELMLENRESTTAATADFLRPGVGAQGDGRVIVRLSSESGATAWVGGRDELNARRAARDQQEAFIARVKSLDAGARVLGRVQLVMNAVFIEVDASKLDEIARDPAVVRIAPVGHYELDLTETVPYIGAAAAQKGGVTGKGIKVAVLDSGIDYTHAALGGSGNPAQYAANDPSVVEPGTFPTAKVKGGFDFVGSAWVGSPGPPEAPDPDPLDDGATNPSNQGVGHGTHVAHIIGGKGGVAPGVDLYGVKVCSSVTTSCSGIALIQGMEFAVDPNGDGRVRDRVDIINMSLGSDYGQAFDDDLSLAVDNATRFGTLTVASAGNGGDKPYVTGTPAAAPSALSVAQTQVPSANLQLISVAGANHPAVFQPWSAPLGGTLTGPVQYGDGAGGQTLGCSLGPDPNGTGPGTEPYPAGSLAGKIVLVNRGVCNFSIKIFNIQRGGGVAGIIGLVDSSAPFTGSFGAGGPFTIPGYMISLASANAIRAALPATGTIDPSNTIPLVGQLAGSSARGPQHESTQLIKPEIGAPGASVSAVAGSGDGTEPFSGTSGASPMVAGSAALVMDEFGGSKRPLTGRPLLNALIPGLSPVEVKARLMNTAETDIETDPFTGLAPITRIGGGEVRVEPALDVPVVAWADDAPTGALGFGFVDVTGTTTITKKVVLRNYNKLRFHTYAISSSFRFANDEASGAVALSMPSSVRVRPSLLGPTTFEVTMTIDGSKLPANAMSSGSDGANPARLTLNEFDGYITLTGGGDTIHLPWHVLPRKAASVTPSTTTITPGSLPQVVGLNNGGAGVAQNDAYALVATSPNIPEGPQGGQAPTPDIRAVGVNTFPVPEGFCSEDPSFLWAFAIASHERQEHLLPVSYWVYLDIDGDDEADYAVLNRDVSLNNVTDGRQLAWSVNLETGAADAFFFAEHSTNTGNTVLLVCAEQVGLSGDDLPDFSDPTTGTKVGVSVEATDFYYGGPGDVVEDIVITPLGERFVGVPTDVPAGTNDPGALDIYDFGLWPGNTPELGLLLFTNGDRGAGARGGATKETEALLFTVS